MRNSKLIKLGALIMLMSFSQANASGKICDWLFSNKIKVTDPAWIGEKVAHRIGIESHHQIAEDGTVYIYAPQYGTITRFSVWKSDHGTFAEAREEAIISISYVEHQNVELVTVLQGNRLVVKVNGLICVIDFTHLENIRGAWMRDSAFSALLANSLMDAWPGVFRRTYYPNGLGIPRNPLGETIAKMDSTTEVRRHPVHPGGRQIVDGPEIPFEPRFSPWRGKQ